MYFDVWGLPVFYKTFGVDILPPSVGVGASSEALRTHVLISTRLTL